MSSTTSDTATAKPLQLVNKGAILGAAVQVLAQQIQQWKRHRAPRGLDQKIEAARAADKTTTSRIMLDHGGFVAWLSFCLATEGKAHFSGRLHQGQVIEAFKALPFNDRVTAARHLAQLRLPPTAARHIHRIGRRLEDKGFLPRPQENDQTLLTQGTSLAGRPEPDSRNLSPTVVRDTATRASLEDVAEVFGEYICYAIRKVLDLSYRPGSMNAAVTMEFPTFALHDCVMMLEIREEEVEHLVKKLFGIDVVSVGGIRHLNLGKGVRLTSNTSNPEITLKGARDEAIVKTLGLEVYEAVMASRMRGRELEEGRKDVTECVAMIFTSKSGEAAYMNVCLDLEGGLRIRDKLYR